MEENWEKIEAEYIEAAEKVSENVWQHMLSQLPSSNNSDSLVMFYAVAMLAVRLIKGGSPDIEEQHELYDVFLEILDDVGSRSEVTIINMN